MRLNSADNAGVVLAVLVLPLGRPGLRFLLGLAALAFSAACSEAVRTTCSTAMGNERRSLVLMSERVKNARPGTLLPYREAKKRSRPGVCLPDLVTTVSSPASR